MENLLEQRGMMIKSPYSGLRDNSSSRRGPPCKKLNNIYKETSMIIIISANPMHSLETSFAGLLVHQFFNFLNTNKDWREWSCFIFFSFIA